MKHTGLNLTWPYRYHSLKGLNESIEPGMRVLDVACSYGIETTRLASIYPQTEFIGIDIDENAINIARKGIWHTSLFEMPKKNLWHPAGLPDTFKYGNNRYVKPIFNERGRLESYLNKKTGERITQDDYLEPWSEIKRNQFLKNLKFKVQDLDYMNFDKSSFDIIIATSCVFLPTIRLFGETRELTEDEKVSKDHYEKYFLSFLKKKGVLFTDDEVFWNQN